MRAVASGRVLLLNTLQALEMEISTGAIAGDEDLREVETGNPGDASAHRSGLADQPVENGTLVRLGGSTLGLALAGLGFRRRIGLGFVRRFETAAQTASAQRERQGGNSQKSANPTHHLDQAQFGPTSAACRNAKGLVGNYGRSLAPPAILFQAPCPRPSHFRDVLWRSSPIALPGLY